MIKIKVAELLQQHGMNATDMMRDAKISYGTAHRLSHDKGKGISFEVLDALCALFSAEVGDILEYEPDD
jgi:DNA-binding Xre family transcriptional regulator